MSFEGHYQVECVSGHIHIVAYEYYIAHSEIMPILSICPFCSKMAKKYYLVDDTNCDGEEIDSFSDKWIVISEDAKEYAFLNINEAISYARSVGHNDTAEHLENETKDAIKLMWE